MIEKEKIGKQNICDKRRLFVMFFSYTHTCIHRQIEEFRFLDNFFFLIWADARRIPASSRSFSFIFNNRNLWEQWMQQNCVVILMRTECSTFLAGRQQHTFKQFPARSNTQQHQQSHKHFDNWQPKSTHYKQNNDRSLVEWLQ